ncbi:MAG: undecaprenyl/decaprenyl-phosphate alpha-N-acetylglucosaminyl 1-phosphate transferase [PVC group bacterium]|nr:undecaprenyl/decaprenyl-phosphate alpha-N-acetylglucosaminyl 1-phosphate transferase [PVC group bacterium]
MKTLAAFLLSFLSVLLLTPLFRKIALYLKIMDIPNKRKVHSAPIPLFGGLAIYSGVIVSFFMFQESFVSFLPIIIGASVILYMGALDDIKGLSAKIRFFIQLGVACAVVALGVKVSFLPAGLLGNIGEFLVTVFWIVGVTNAFNYLDGLDGLAAGSAVVNFFCFSVILYITGQFLLGFVAVILMGACLGFLPYNVTDKQKMFLGDAGSMFLGFMLAGMAIIGNWAEDNIVKLFIPILVLGVPIFDMIFTTIMRIKEEKVKNVIEWLRYGGKDHFHHYLVDLGLKQRGAVLFIYYLTLSLGLGAIMVSNDTAVEGVLTIIQASIIFGVIGFLIVIGKKHRMIKEK